MQDYRNVTSKGYIPKGFMSNSLPCPAKKWLLIFNYRTGHLRGILSYSSLSVLLKKLIVGHKNCFCLGNYFSVVYFCAQMQNFSSSTLGGFKMDTEYTLYSVSEKTECTEPSYQIWHQPETPKQASSTGRSTTWTSPDVLGWFDFVCLLYLGLSLISASLNTLNFLWNLCKA